jgi:alpha-aminoadipate/glutamate carrier protein LysW
MVKMYSEVGGYSTGGGIGSPQEDGMVTCPLCNEALDVDEEELDEGDPLTCEQCGANLTVSSLAPLELIPDDEDEEDFEEQEYDEEYEEDEDDDEDDEEEEDEGEEE